MIFLSENFLVIPDIILNGKGNFAGSYFNNMINGNLDSLFTFTVLHMDIYTLKIQ